VPTKATAPAAESGWVWRFAQPSLKRARRVDPLEDAKIGAFHVHAPMAGNDERLG
jgi:hypothetical protein